MCFRVCVCGPSHKYSVSSTGAVTMTELMTVMDVKIAPPHVRVYVLFVRLSRNTRIHQINYAANIINITTFQGMVSSFQK